MGIVNLWINSLEWMSYGYWIVALIHDRVGCPLVTSRHVTSSILYRICVLIFIDVRGGDELWCSFAFKGHQEDIKVSITFLELNGLHGWLPVTVIGTQSRDSYRLLFKWISIKHFLLMDRSGIGGDCSLERISTVYADGRWKLDWSNISIIHSHWKATHMF